MDGSDVDGRVFRPADMEWQKDAIQGCEIKTLLFNKNAACAASGARARHQAPEMARTTTLPTQCISL